jgi:hypothetical protein
MLNKKEENSNYTMFLIPCKYSFFENTKVKEKESFKKNTVSVL